MLVGFLCGRNQQVTRFRNPNEAPTISKLYEDPQVLASNAQWLRILEIFRKGIALRPSRAARKMYLDVSRAYWEAVYAVLTRKKSGAQAADELERMLRTPDVRASADLNRAPAQR